MNATIYAQRFKALRIISGAWGHVSSGQPRLGEPQIYLPRLPGTEIASPSLISLSIISLQRLHPARLLRSSSCTTYDICARIHSGRRTIIPFIQSPSHGGATFTRIARPQATAILRLPFSTARGAPRVSSYNGPSPEVILMADTQPRPRLRCSALRESFI